MKINMKSQVEILDDTIASLKIKKKQDLSLLKTEINSITKSLNPINILKTAQTEVVGFVKEEGIIFNNIIKIGTKEISSKIYKAVSKSKVVRFLEKKFLKKSN
jgi:hypothetical protein